MKLDYKSEITFNSIESRLKFGIWAKKVDLLSCTVQPMCYQWIIKMITLVYKLTTTILVTHVETGFC